MRCAYISAKAMTALCLTAGMVLGFVGVTDRCALPTPYPPPGAAAGAVRNSGFEAGFTNGAATQWVAFKDDVYPGQLHFEGTERAAAGSAAQRLVLPQPTYNDQKAGLYQQIWVVPGGTYAATVRVYLDPPAQQTFNGEDLIALLGLDAYGEASGDGGGMVWSSAADSPRTWVTLTVNCKAVLPVMTVSLKAVRKAPQHGNDAQVWFDSVTLSGPTPTGRPPGPEPEPIDFDTLVPRTIGPNMVENPSFERPFAEGISAGWNKWSAAGEGVWRQSRRVGKVGGGRYDCGPLEGLAEMNPKTILLYGGTPSPVNPNDAGGNGTYGDVSRLADEFAQLENTIIVGRPAIDTNWDTYRTNPAFYGRQLADQLWIKQQQFPRIDCWQGLNEPDTAEGWQAALAFERAFADRAHELGLKVVSLNLSTGSPGNYWRMVDETFQPSCRDVMDVADYLGHHCYGGPNDDLMITNQSRDDVCSYAMRPRRFKDMYDRRGWRFPPVIATEGSTWTAWRGNWRPETIANDLTSMGGYMNANRWWCGYTNFAVGGSCGWASFDILGQGSITRDVGAWNAANPADAVDGVYSQMFGAGHVHPKTIEEMAPAGQFVGGINRKISGLTPGRECMVACWMKYEFRGHQPQQLKFYIGVDTTGQTTDPGARTIDWGLDQISINVAVHEIFTRAWRTFVPAGPNASIWFRADHPTADPSFMVYLDGVEVRQLTDSSPTPVLEVSPAHIELSATVGAVPAPASLVVRNASAAGTLSYSVSDNVEWLTVGPASGTSTGESDTIILKCDSARLAPGTYQALVNVSAPGAANAVQTIAINLTVATLRADFDRDGHVDEADFAFFQRCLTGSGQPPTSEACKAADLDGDGDVDLSDFTRFQNCISGKEMLPGPDCVP